MAVKEYTVSLNGVSGHSLTLRLGTNVVANWTNVHWTLFYDNRGSLNTVKKLLVKFNEETQIDTTKLAGSVNDSTIASGNFKYTHFADGSGKFLIYVYFERDDIEGAYAEINEEFICKNISSNPLSLQITGNKLGETITAVFATDGMLWKP